MDAESLRIIDANLNRAREALRVVEDHARFTLDDAHAAARAKSARHELTRIARAVGPNLLLERRDIDADVGRDAKTPAELRRASADDVLRAGFARACEALRVLSEYLKLHAAEPARIAERIRYDCYELEQRIMLRGDLARRFRSSPLYVIVSEALCQRDWRETAEAAMRGGAACLQLREKNLSDAELLRRAVELRSLTRRHGVLMIVNDRADIAKLCGADGVHLGWQDLPVRDARRIGGGRLLIGKSTHTLEQLDAALRERPDYVAVGPIFQSSTKPGRDLAGIEMLTRARERSHLPLVAIGGITGKNVREVTTAADCRPCVCSAVISANDPENAAREIITASGGD